MNEARELGAIAKIGLMQIHPRSVTFMGNMLKYHNQTYMGTVPTKTESYNLDTARPRRM